MSKFFIDRPVFAGVIAIVIVLAGLVAGAAAAGRAVPGDRAADGTDHHELPGRQRRDARQDRRRADRGAALRRREPALFQLELLLERQPADHRHLRGRHQRRQGGLQRQQPRAARAAAPARRGAAQRRHRAEALARHPAAWSRCISPDNSRDTLFLSNYAHDQPGRRAEARARRSRRDDLRRARLLDAHLAAARPAWRAWASRPRDVANAMRAQNAQYAAGKIGAEPAPPGPEPRLHRHRARAPGRAGGVRRDRGARAAGPAACCASKDVARVELGAQNYDTSNTLDGKPAIGMATFLQSGANALEVADAITAQHGGAARRRSREDVDYLIPFDTTRFVDGLDQGSDDHDLRGGAAGDRWSCSCSCRPGARR